MPNPEWGGAGSLGCDLGRGILHRLPFDSFREQAKLAKVHSASLSVLGAGRPVSPACGVHTRHESSSQNHSKPLNYNCT